MEKAIYVFEDVYAEPAARSQAESEKSNAFGWAAKLKLWDRPKEADIQLLSSEKRFEPFWNIAAERNSTFEKKEEYRPSVLMPSAFVLLIGPSNSVASVDLSLRGLSPVSSVSRSPSTLMGLIAKRRRSRLLITLQHSKNMSSAKTKS